MGKGNGHAPIITPLPGNAKREWIAATIQLPLVFSSRAGQPRGG
jgi:hypothetical protein